MRRLMSVSIMACAAAVALGVACSPAAALSGRPYAAQVTAAVLGTVDVKYSDDQTTYMVCENQASENDLSETFSLDWEASYPRINLPLLTASQLGSSLRSIHLNLSPPDGTGELMAGDYQINGEGPPTDGGNQTAGGSDCTQVPYGGQGRITASGPAHTAQVRSDGQLITSPASFFGSQILDLGMPLAEATPATYKDSLGDTAQVMGDLAEATDQIPYPGGATAAFTSLATWETVPVQAPLSRLRQLAHKSRLKLAPVVYSGTHDCSASDANGITAQQCSVSWVFRYTIVLKRTRLYRLGSTGGRGQTGALLPGGCRKPSRPQALRPLGCRNGSTS
jgi:hypothetical protein